MTIIRDDIDFNYLDLYSKQTFKINLIKNSLGDFWQVPVMVAKGSEGKTIGITAAIHGNELNGIPTIHALWEAIDEKKLSGTIVLVPVVNVPGFMNGTREFPDGKDLNRIMPGKKHGPSSSRYVYEMIEKIGKQFDYHLDLHTASHGRVNSYYLKAKLDDKVTFDIAKTLAPSIMVNEVGPKGSFRSIYESFNKPSLTLELGDPNIIQSHHVEPAFYGILNVLKKLKFLDVGKNKSPKSVKHKPVICDHSQWFYARHGGILVLLTKLLEKVHKGQPIARITNIYGEKVVEINAKFDGVVIGQSTYPVCDEGSRVVHLGNVEKSYK